MKEIENIGKIGKRSEWNLGSICLAIFLVSGFRVTLVFSDPMDQWIHEFNLGKAHSVAISRNGTQIITESSFLSSQMRGINDLTPDADGDGIPDSLEGGRAPLPHQSNLYLPDSDGDGLWDGVEDANRNGIQDPGETSTRNRDSDGDGFEDGIEVFFIGSDPIDPARPGIRYVDTDGDGLPDFLDPNPFSPDADGDRFLDGYEAVTLGMAAVGNPLMRPTLGDVDGNAVWDNGDSQMILKFIADLPAVAGFDFTRTDLDRNGVIDNADAQQSLNFFGGLIPHLPAKAAAAPPEPEPTPIPPTSTPTPIPTIEEIVIQLPGLPEGAIPLTLVRIPAGSFQMGSMDGPEWSWCYPCEQPVHPVTIISDFFLGMYPVTQAQWEAVMGNNPSYFQDCGYDCPVEMVSWDDIRGRNGFLDCLNALGQGTFRLPSEAQWEYACRAGSTTRFYFGDSNCDPGSCDPCDLEDYAWYCGNDTPHGTKPVGQKIPNAFGLFDMHGLVNEWCEDAWHDNYHGAPTDGSPWYPSSSGHKVLRGGRWNHFPRVCRSTYRGSDGPRNRFNDRGLRLVWEPPIPPTETPVPPTSTPIPPTNTPTPLEQEIVIDLPGLPAGAKPLTLVRIPAGSFQMGSPNTEEGRLSNEGPVRTVTIGHGFYMSKYPVTQAQWEAVMGFNPSHVLGVGDDYPVYRVMWKCIREPNGFMDRLNDLGQGAFRLPSEAEWEYACRAGTATRFYFGDSLECGDTCLDCEAGVLPGNRTDYMWFCQNFLPNGFKPVGGKWPNAFGLYDMHGNAGEWCEDDWHESHINAPTDGSPRVNSPRASQRVVRGGAWDLEAMYCRSASRFGKPYASPESLTYGFRVVMDLSNPPTRTPTPPIEIPTPTFEEIIIGLPNLPVGVKPLTMVRIPAGDFLMGSPDSENGRFGFEVPLHPVTIHSDFYIGKYPVTQAQWVAVMGSNPSHFLSCGDDCPVDSVSWNEIRGPNGFLDQLNALVDGTFRLPSEAEWEYACRAGTTTRFHFGDSRGCGGECWNCEAGVLPGNRADYMWYCWNNTPFGTKPVGQKIPNAFGLHDMHGLIWEWCEDDHHPSYVGAPSDGSAWVDSPRAMFRSLRGGSWNKDAVLNRSAMRGSSYPSGGFNDQGFRLVMTP